MQDAGASPPRILVVDDSRESRFLLGKLLERFGHAVHTAANGLEALNALGDFQPEIVLLDLGMPGLDGYEVTRRMRAARSDDELLIVIISGYAMETDKLRSLQSGANHHLAKPVDINELLAIIHDWANRKPERLMAGRIAGPCLRQKRLA